jgi:predicted kinase
MTLHIIILQGLPASGKSTWAKSKVDKEKGKYIRINKDDIRAMLGAPFSKDLEGFVLRLRDEAIVAALDRKLNVIVDDTNLNGIHIENISILAQKYASLTGVNVDVEIKVFDVYVETCIERDALRSNPVGAKVIRDMAQRYLKGHCRPVQYPQVATGLPHCVICDLDGTLALVGDRSPYDASLCDKTDEVNIPVKVFLEHCGVQVIFLSGREDKYEAPTRRFLEHCGFGDKALYMRQTGDSRKDSVVKKELYDKHIKDKYNVLVVLDDRDQMVRMWRSEVKVPCFQVNYGDF